MALRSRRGFLIVDAVFGLMIVATVTVTLVATVRHERSAELNLADSRGALHLAEHALLNLQHGQPIPATTADSKLIIRPTQDGAATAGYIWAKVEATVHGHHRALLGVVAVGSIPATEAK